MTDSTQQNPILMELLALSEDEAFDWDPSALADWPNIAPAHSSLAEFAAADH